MRRAGVVAGAVVVVIVVVIAIALAVNLNRSTPTGSDSPSQGRSATNSEGDVGVPTTFPAQQRQPFQAPPVLRSQNGVLETTFTVQTTTFKVAGAEIKGFSYDGRADRPYPSRAAGRHREDPSAQPARGAGRICTATACSSGRSASRTTCSG